VDTTSPVWSWRPGSVNPSHQILDQMQRARWIRDAFFNPGSKNPAAKFFDTYGDLDANAQRAVVIFDGRITDDKSLKQPVTWPGTTAGNVTTQFEARYFDPPKSYGGPWALCRMIDDTRTGAAYGQQRIGL